MERGHRDLSVHKISVVEILILSLSKLLRNVLYMGITRLIFTLSQLWSITIQAQEQASVFYLETFHFCPETVIRREENGVRLYTYKNRTEQGNQVTQNVASQFRVSDVSDLT